MSQPTTPRFSFLQGFLALLVVVFLGFICLLTIPFEVTFGSTTTTTSALFGSVATTYFVHDLFFLYALRVPIEVFGYASIVNGFNWYFFIVLAFGILQWFIAGLLTRNYKANVILWIFGLFLLFAIALLGIRIPLSNVPAYDAFVALYNIAFSINILVPVIIYSVVALGSAGIGTFLSQRYHQKKVECTLQDLAANQCVRV